MSRDRYLSLEPVDYSENEISESHFKIRMNMCVWLVDQ